MPIALKQAIKRLIRGLGYEISHARFGVPGAMHRPIGQMDAFLQDVKARGFEPGFILDVGANEGSWTRAAKKIFPRAAFLLIEPQREMKGSLDLLCSEFGDVSWVEAGAGPREESLVQTILDDLQGSTFLPTARADLLSSGKQRNVKMLTIDSILTSHGRGLPDFVKLDIQGFELQALEGAHSLFGHTELFILETSLYPFCEGMPTLRDIIMFMGNRGYETYDIPGYLRRPLDGALGQIDVAFAKRDGRLRGSCAWA